MHKKISEQFELSLSVHYDIYIPEKNDDLSLIIALHGYGENKDMMLERLKANLKSQHIIVSLQAPYPHMKAPILPGKPIKYGFGWITSFEPQEAIQLHHQFINRVLADVKNKLSLDAPVVFLLGFSQSVALNFRYVFSHPDKVDAVIAICGGLPGDWSTSNIYSKSKTQVLYLGCKNDPIYPPEKIKDNCRKLGKLCSSVTSKIVDCSHEITEESFSEIDKFIQSVKEKKL